MTKRIDTQVAVIGAGTAGMYALRELRRAKIDYVLIDHGPLGTTCARVGCMPSKVALHAADMWQARQDMAEHLGVTGSEGLRRDMDEVWRHVRSYRDYFAGKTAKGTVATAGERLIYGKASFLSPSSLLVQGEDGPLEVHAQAIIIATGSRPVVPAFLEPMRERVWTTDELFEQSHIPPRVGMLGLGVIGLEMGLALSRMGVTVVGADMAERIAGIADPVVAQLAQEKFGAEFPMWLGQAAELELSENGIRMRAGAQEAEVDVVIAALGRRSNVDQLGLEAIGIALDARGLPRFDSATMQIDGQPIYIAGDVNGFRPLMHEAAAQGGAAGFNATRAIQGQASLAFAQKTPLAIAFTGPDIATAGASWTELNPDEVVVGEVNALASPRHKVLNATDGVLRVYADAQTGRLLGGSMLAVGGEHIAHMLAASIQRGETASEALELPYYHPVVEELLSSALQAVVKQLPQASPWPMGLRPATA